MWKVLSFLLVLLLAGWAAWHFGILQSVGQTFDDWLSCIGLGSENGKGFQDNNTSDYWNRNRK